MSRKSSLTEIAKAYEQVLEEMNIGIPSVGDSVLIKNALSPLKSGEEMADVAISADTNREKCPCEDGNCEEEEEVMAHDNGCNCGEGCDCEKCSKKNAEEDCEDS